MARPTALENERSHDRVALMPKRASTSAEPSESPPGAFERFEAFLTKIVRVPKREIDEQEAKYQHERERERTASKRKRAV